MYYWNLSTFKRNFCAFLIFIYYNFYFVNLFYLTERWSFSFFNQSVRFSWHYLRFPLKLSLLFLCNDTIILCCPSWNFVNEKLKRVRERERESESEREKMIVYWFESLFFIIITNTLVEPIPWCDKESVKKSDILLSS